VTLLNWWLNEEKGSLQLHQVWCFRIEQNEDPLSNGILHKPGIPRMEGSEPLLSYANRIL